MAHAAPRRCAKSAKTVRRGWPFAFDEFSLRRAAGTSPPPHRYALTEETDLFALPDMLDAIIAGAGTGAKHYDHRLSRPSDASSPKPIRIFVTAQKARLKDPSLPQAATAAGNEPMMRSPRGIEQNQLRLAERARRRHDDLQPARLRDGAPCWRRRRRPWNGPSRVQQYDPSK